MQVYLQAMLTETVCNLEFMKTECKKINESQWLTSLPSKSKLGTLCTVQSVIYYRGICKIVFEPKKRVFDYSNYN